MKSGDVLFWIWLAEALGPAYQKTSQLLSLYDNPYDLFQAEEAELERIEDFPERVRAALSDKSLKHASDILSACERLGISILTYGEDEYPYVLRELADPPILLYYIGQLPDWNRKLCVAMVGTRRMSAYGLHSSYRIAYETAMANAVVVSGMATGIDGVCSAAALAANGETVAVLGCGVDSIYPKHHRRLRDAICKRGAVISEYPPGTEPRGYHFPARNRIISGMSQATVVLEAGIGSGSLITAKDAILQGRQVYALPANVGSHGAEGTNGLLRDGAKPIIEAADLLEAYRHVYADTLAINSMLQNRAAPYADLHYLQELGVIELTEHSQKNGASVGTVATQSLTQKKLREAEEKSRRVTVKKKREQAESKKMEKTVAEIDECTDGGQTPDEVLSSLTPVQQAVLAAIPDDRAISADSLNALDYPYGDVVAALTVLEIMGMIQKLPGALYTKL
ncbi:MAG: DNA-processing protein DprA [Clostridia bacterium]|nr:DNA-processing protein DprA [Clostridia bacterium]